MAQKDFRHLRRTELVEIIYKLQEEQDELKQQLADLQAELDSKELKISEAGSLADAAVAVNGIFESAQSAADQYLAQIQAIQSSTEQEAAGVISQAQVQADAIIRDAETKRDAILASAKAGVDGLLSDAQKDFVDRWVALSVSLKGGHAEPVQDDGR